MLQTGPQPASVAETQSRSSQLQIVSYEYRSFSASHFQHPYRSYARLRKQSE